MIDRIKGKLQFQGKADVIQDDEITELTIDSGSEGLLLEPPPVPPVLRQDSDDSSMPGLKSDDDDDGEDLDEPMV